MRGDNPRSRCAYRSQCDTPSSTWCVAGRDHANANGLAETFSFQTLLVLLAKYTQGCVQTFHLRGIQGPLIDTRDGAHRFRSVKGFAVA